MKIGVRVSGDFDNLKMNNSRMHDDQQCRQSTRQVMLEGDDQSISSGAANYEYAYEKQLKEQLKDSF